MAKGGLQTALLGAAMFGALTVHGAIADAAIDAMSAPQADAAVEIFLGHETVEIMATANRVESFQLEAKTGMTDPAVQGYAVREQGPNLTQAQADLLRGLVFKETSFVFEKSKRCPFLADAGFVFHAGERQATIALSMSCKLWSFAQAAERPKIEDYDPIESDIKTLITELFTKP